MLKFELSDVKLFKNLCDVTGCYVDELRFDCTSAGVSFVALNKGHVVFLECMVESDWFTSYNCSEDVSFMVDCRELTTALSRIKGDGQLTASLDDEFFTLKHTSVDGSVKRFKIRLISSDYEPPSPPNIDYPSHALAEFQQLKEFVSDAMLYDPTKVKFVFEDGNVRILSSTDYTTFESNMVLLEEVNEPCTVVLSNEHLKDFFKLNIAEEVRIDSGNGMPLRATLRTVDECITYKFLIAPRIEEERSDE